MSNPAEVNDTYSHNREGIDDPPNRSGPSRGCMASGSNVQLENIPSNLFSVSNDEEPPRQGVGATFTRGHFTDPPRQMDTARLAEMEEGHAGGNETHELTDLSPNQRIAALEQRIEALEILIRNMGLEGVGERPQATITPWRVLNTALVLGLGAYKAITTYRGQSMGPTTADWIGGVVWTLISYWVSFFDDPTPSHSGSFFTYDMSGVVFAVSVNLAILGVGVVGGGAILIAGILAFFNTWGDNYSTLVLGIIIFILFAVVVAAALGTVGDALLALFWHAPRFSIPAFPRFPRGLFRASDWSLRRLGGLVLVLLLPAMFSLPNRI
ncbi:hypothetical protein B0H16DRAFT_1720247 [Mycena metata]|uniref:Uncharacterized protein n=1 Tax=Mycena metata TaxID=1033252 RepID=A0AAD7J9D9_9AGAR|nr:hypothetical protein B0H16DRAFT_1720247 [Mycena metata]